MTSGNKTLDDLAANVQATKSRLLDAIEGDVVFGGDGQTQYSSYDGKLVSELVAKYHEAFVRHAAAVANQQSFVRSLRSLWRPIESAPRDGTAILVYAPIELHGVDREPDELPPMTHTMSRSSCGMPTRTIGSSHFGRASGR